MHSSNKIVIGIILAAVIIGGSLLYVSGRTPNVSFSVQGGDTGPSDTQQTPGFAAGTCPTSGQTTATFDLKNGEDTTGDNTFDATGYLFGSKGHFVTQTDTTAGTATLNCGETYTLRLVSADGNNADNSKITDVEQGVDAVLNGEGSVTFTPSSSAYYLKVVGSQHGVVEFRVKDLDENAFLFRPSQNSNAYALTGAVFNGTTAAAENTSVSVGAGGKTSFEVWYRANETDSNAADHGYWILIDADTADWNEPTIYLDGALLTNSKGSMSTDELRQFGSEFEYAYKISGKITDAEHVAKVELRALDSVNPAHADSPEFAIAAIGAYKSTTSNTVNIAAANDASAATRVYTLQTITRNVL